ncbi:hypothetical protein, partial [Moorena sp. SIO4E2]
LENYRVEADPNFVFEKNRFSKDVFKIKYSGQQLIDQYPEVADLILQTLDLSRDPKFPNHKSGIA